MAIFNANSYPHLQGLEAIYVGLERRPVASFVFKTEEIAKIYHKKMESFFEDSRYERKWQKPRTVIFEADEPFCRYPSHFPHCDGSKERTISCLARPANSGYCSMEETSNLIYGCLMGMHHPPQPLENLKVEIYGVDGREGEKPYEQIQGLKAILFGLDLAAPEATFVFQTAEDANICRKAMGGSHSDDSSSGATPLEVQTVRHLNKWSTTHSKVAEDCLLSYGAKTGKPIQTVQDLIHKCGQQMATEGKREIHAVPIYGVKALY